MKLKEYLLKAQKEKWAIGQFNFSTLEQLKAIVGACEKLNSPAIIGTSEGESGFVGLEQAVALVGSYRKNKNLAIFLNLDHGRSFDYIKKAIDTGYDAVHFDGSKLDFEKNIDILRKIQDYSQKKNILIEGEFNPTLGASRMLEKAPETKQGLTDPGQALEFTKQAKIDSLAISIGSFHGIESSGKSPMIDFDRLKKIKERMKEFLVLHGGSGVSDQDTKQVISQGIVKININTELRLAYRDTLKQVLENRPQETTPYKLMPEVVSAVQKIVENKIKLFGSDNKT
ncbi:MAG: class II fructose-bisphosphate aldolase [Patescibacteria group bacterium]|nr:class II fructose-bisphosphate aldolase [Patescibacteria group bacterium]